MNFLETVRFHLYAKRSIKNAINKADSQSSSSSLVSLGSKVESNKEKLCSYLGQADNKPYNWISFSYECKRNSDRVIKAIYEGQLIEQKANKKPGLFSRLFSKKTEQPVVKNPVRPIKEPGASSIGELQKKAQGQSTIEDYNVGINRTPPVTRKNSPGLKKN